MYLRGLRYQLATVQGQRIVRQARRPTSVAFSTFHPKHRQESGREQPHIHSRDTDKSKGNGSRFAPFRPITLFAICIPLGYALKWAFQRQDDAENGITSDGFVKYTLTSKEDISSTCSIFTLQPATSSPIDTLDPSLKHTITSVQFKQPQLQICRNYTLLPRTDSQDPKELRFLIRRERNGEVSGYLHRLPLGADIEVRGVFPEYQFDDGSSDARLRVLFLAGGTGIAPAMQGAQILAPLADVHILWASRRREDCLGGISDTVRSSSSGWNLWGWWSRKSGRAGSQEKGTIVSELDQLKNHALSGSQPTKLLVNYFVDEEGMFIQPSDVQKLLQNDRIDVSGENFAARKILFVSGPDGFINHWAAPKQWKDGHEVQGRLGGVLSTLDLNGWEVVKL